MLDNGVSNHLDYIAPFFLKGLKFLHIFILTISLNREKGPTLLPLCVWWSLYSFEFVELCSK